MDAFAYTIHLSLLESQDMDWRWSRINDSTIDTFYPAFKCPNDKKPHFGINDDTVVYWKLVGKKGYVFGILMRPDCWVPNRFILIHDEKKSLKKWLKEFQAIKCNVCNEVYDMKHEKFAEILSLMKDTIKNKEKFLAYAVENREAPPAVKEYMEVIEKVFR
jgi:hypothetical protein